MQKWERIAPGFHQWFQGKADVFKNSVIAPVRRSAQLGSKPYTDNANESQNFVIKDWVEFKKSSMPSFVTKLRSFVQQSLDEASRAVYGAGDYYLVEEFRHLEVELLFLLQLIFFIILDRRQVTILVVFICKILLF